MHYKLVGFSQQECLRQFRFERAGTGVAHAPITVLADLTLVRKFEISLQELPSLCARFLEARPVDEPSGTLTLTDAELSLHAAANRSAALEDRAKRDLRSRRGVLAAAARTRKNEVPVA